MSYKVVLVLLTAFAFRSLLNYLYPIGETNPIADETRSSHKVFGKDIFQQATAENKIYLAILGCVYDVTKGKKYYQPEGSYSFFAGDLVAKKKYI